ncbi:MAG: sel1 repeat family protein [Kiritimatiellae bacterium]|nr:sel1 repeat family protein [Kiritimatiellia bacterium]
MKSVAAILCATLFAASAFGADGEEPVLDVLNLRTGGSPVRYARAVKRVADDARKGRLLQRYIAAILADDPSVPEDARISEAERIEWLEKTRERMVYLAEKKNNPLAWYLLYLETGDIEKLDRAVAGGNVQAMNARGTALVSRVLAHPGDPEADRKDLETAFSLFSKASKSDDANAFNNLGLCYMNGYGCRKDEEKALEAFRTAAEQGHAEAVNNEGRFYREGIVVEKDLEEALRCFRRSASAGNEWGQLNYALAILRGEGTKPDGARAAEILDCLARKGRLEAMDVLAGVYRDGAPGIEPDSAEAAVWMMRARAARGDANAVKWLESSGKAIKTGAKR